MATELQVTRKKESKCSMPNCYGTKVEDLMRNTKERLPLDLLQFLLNLNRCSNSRTRNNALSNFVNSLIYIASEILKQLNNDATNGNPYDFSSLDGPLSDDSLTRLLEEYDKLRCAGYGIEIDELNDKYNQDGGKTPTNTFPDNLSESDKQLLNEWLISNDNGNDFKIDENGDGDNSIVVVDNSLDSDGDTNSGSGTGWKNPLIKIPDDDLLNLTFNGQIFKCFDPVFNVRNYIFLDTNPMITSEKKENLRRLHYDILLPIFYHYYGINAPSTCQIKIYIGLTDLKNTINYASGSSFSHHLRGRAVDFTMVGVSEQKFLKDIIEKNITLPFGIVTITNGVHITLPFTFEGLDVEGMVLSSPKNSQESLTIQFV